jgi:hypothetical protein
VAARLVLKLLGAVLLVTSIVPLAGGIYGATKPVGCDGTVMRPGDSCIITRSGAGGTRNEIVGYDEMVRRHNSALPSGLAIGLPMLALGAGGLAWGWHLGRR